MGEPQDNVLGVLAMRPHVPAHEVPRTKHELVRGEPDCRWLLPGESYSRLSFWLGADAERA
ncbi:hypothetical protein [Microcystis phage MJing1]|nr:hypothetical protein [Microcystis phage MJing1]